MSTAVKSRRISDLLGLLGPAVLLPWPSGSKGDRRKWKHLQLTDMDEGSHLAKLDKAGNIGVALGKASEGLVTIDLDQDCCVDAFLEANPLLADTLRSIFDDRLLSQMAMAVRPQGQAVRGDRKFVYSLGLCS